VAEVCKSRTRHVPLAVMSPVAPHVDLLLPLGYEIGRNSKQACCHDLGFQLGLHLADFRVKKLSSAIINSV
jgi:hypothetical protein